MNEHYGILISSEELRHFGIKGMQWGVRKDGKRGSSGRASLKSALQKIGAKTSSALDKASLEIGRFVVGAAIGVSISYLTNKVVEKIAYR